MRNLITAVLFGILAFTAQAQQPKIGTRLHSVVNSSGKTVEPQTINYQLELTISRAGKTARYRMAFNGGSVQTDLIEEQSSRLSISGRVRWIVDESPAANVPGPVVDEDAFIFRKSAADQEMPAASCEWRSARESDVIGLIVAEIRY